MTRSSTSWSPALASVELPSPKPILPEPKLEMSPIAKPARIMMKNVATMPVPTFDLDKRRKLVIITVRWSGGTSAALGAGLARIKTRDYGLGKREKAQWR